MARRKNTKFIDPRYFMDEKTEKVNESSYRQHQGGWYGSSNDDAGTGAPEVAGEAGQQLVSALADALEEGGDSTSWVVDEVDGIAGGTYSMGQLREMLDEILDQNLGKSLEEFGL